MGHGKYKKGVSPSNAACAVRFTPAISAGTLAAEAAAASLVVAAPATLGGLVAEEGGLVAAIPQDSSVACSGSCCAASSDLEAIRTDVRFSATPGSLTVKLLGLVELPAVPRPKGHPKAVVIAWVSE